MQLLASFRALLLAGAAVGPDSASLASHHFKAQSTGY
jgi:hypothetical protein